MNNNHLVLIVAPSGSQWLSATLCTWLFDLQQHVAWTQHLLLVDGGSGPASISFDFILSALCHFDPVSL